MASCYLSATVEVMLILAWRPPGLKLSVINTLFQGIVADFIHFHSIKTKLLKAAHYVDIKTLLVDRI